MPFINQVHYPFKAAGSWLGIFLAIHHILPASVYSQSSGQSYPCILLQGMGGSYFQPWGYAVIVMALQNRHGHLPTLFSISAEYLEVKWVEYWCVAWLFKTDKRL